jgi:hypothetical protein
MLVEVNDPVLRTPKIGLLEECRLEGCSDAELASNRKKGNGSWRHNEAGESQR